MPQSPGPISGTLPSFVSFASGPVIEARFCRGFSRWGLADSFSGSIAQIGAVPMRMSQVLTALAAEPGERITVEAIVGALSDRSFALLVVLLGAPNCLPMPPPIPAICSVLLIFVAMQMVGLRHSPWLPRALMTRSVRRADVVRTIGRAMPLVGRLEQWSQPRWTWFDPTTGAVLTGVLLALLAVGMLFAAPFVGQVPYGVAVCLVGLGQVERDGLLVALGIAVGVVGFLLSAGFVLAIAMAVRSLI